MQQRVRWHQRLLTDAGAEVPDNCTWEMAARMIGWLDGRDRTDVFIGEEGGSRYLVVAGGNAGRYTVVVQEPDGYFHLARRPAPGESAELVEVAVGGLADFFPPAVVHPLPVALEAAEHYFRTGRRARRFRWVRGGADKR